MKTFLAVIGLGFGILTFVCCLFEPPSHSTFFLAIGFMICTSISSTLKEE